MSGIVPEDFDLEDALNAPSSTDPDKRKRCPNCGRADVRTKTDAPSKPRTTDTRYYCTVCFTHFDDPVEGYDGD